MKVKSDKVAAGCLTSGKEYTVLSKGDRDAVITNDLGKQWIIRLTGDCPNLHPNASWTIIKDSIDDATPEEWYEVGKKIREDKQAYDEWTFKDYQQLADALGAPDCVKEEDQELLASLYKPEWECLSSASYPYSGEYYVNIADEEVSESDKEVNSPAHYNTGTVECIEAISSTLSGEEFQGYLRGNALKYLWRCMYKGKTKQDLEKCKWYLDRLISTL